jgi:hypothetical protein
MATIFVSYRREDASGHAGRLVDRLTARFGEDRVFMDVQDIQPGDRFGQSIDETIARCDCVLAVIGPRWLQMVQERAATGEDFVHREIAAALKRDLTVIPVLVGGARMPAARQLPPGLAPLAHRHAVEIRDERFEDDVGQLTQSLARQLAPGTSRGGASRRRALAYGAAALVVAGLAGTAALLTNRSAPPDVTGTWVAEMQKPGQRPYRIRLELQVAGDTVAGVVEYPTGDGTIHDAQLRGRRLTFATTHVPQFASEPATIRYEAELTDEGIRLVATDAAGVATGVARKTGEAEGTQP